MKTGLQRFSLLMSLALLFACTSTGQRINNIARDAGLARRTVHGLDFQHVVYSNAAAVAGHVTRLLVFLEGDGRPWSENGREPSMDPTTRNPIALQLLARTAAAGIYVSRPCYQQLLAAKCTNEIWTSGRYSRAVVDSMTTAIDAVAREAGAKELVLVGHSGGGTLAVLIGERAQNVAAVITIAANLDIDAWTQSHRYLPLSTSLNPAQSELPHPWRELHFSGARDIVVPNDTTTAYFEKYPQARQRTLPDYGHVCCWIDAWPTLAAEISQQ